MRKYFEYIGLITLMCFSFFMTEKTAMIAKNTDEIMLEIKDKYASFEYPAEGAKIIDKEIIPGKCGKKVNVNESYNEMRKIGYYDDKYYQYDNIKPTISLSDNYDKYIKQGNAKDKNIYFFIELDSSNIALVLEYPFKNYNFIVNSRIYDEHKDIIEHLMKDNSILISNSSFKNYKRIAKDYYSVKKETIYCYNALKEYSFLKSCSSNKSYSISKMSLVSNQHLLNVKKLAQNGSFIKLTLNTELINNLQLVEDYVSSKGLTFQTVKHLEEC